MVERAVNTHERTLITKNGRPAAVLIAVEDWESILETLDVLSDPEAMSAIRQAETEDPSVRVTLDEAKALLTARKSSAAKTR